MTRSPIIWVHPRSDQAQAVMSEVERAIAAHGLSPELSGALEALAHRWEVHPNDWPMPKPGWRGRVSDLFRRQLRRVIWWHHHDQMLRIRSFNGTVNHVLHLVVSLLIEQQRLRSSEVMSLQEHVAALESRVEDLAAKLNRTERGGE